MPYKTNKNTRQIFGQAESSYDGLRSDESELEYWSFDGHTAGPMGRRNATDPQRRRIHQFIASD